MGETRYNLNLYTNTETGKILTYVLVLVPHRKNCEKSYYVNVYEFFVYLYFIHKSFVADVHK